MRITSVCSLGHWVLAPVSVRVARGGGKPSKADRICLQSWDRETGSTFPAAKISTSVCCSTLLREPPNVSQPALCPGRGGAFPGVLVGPGLRSCRDLSSLWDLRTQRSWSWTQRANVASAPHQQDLSLRVQLHGIHEALKDALKLPCKGLMFGQSQIGLSV